MGLCSEVDVGPPLFTLLQPEMLTGVDGVINPSPRPGPGTHGVASNSRQMQHILLAVGNVHANQCQVSSKISFVTKY